MTLLQVYLGSCVFFGRFSGLVVDGKRVGVLGVLKRIYQLMCFLSKIRVLTFFCFERSKIADSVCFCEKG